MRTLHHLRSIAIVPRVAVIHHISTIQNSLESLTQLSSATPLHTAPRVALDGARTQATARRRTWTQNCTRVPRTRAHPRAPTPRRPPKLVEHVMPTFAPSAASNEPSSRETMSESALMTSFSIYVADLAPIEHFSLVFRRSCATGDSIHLRTGRTRETSHSFASTSKHVIDRPCFSPMPVNRVDSKVCANAGAPRLELCAGETASSCMHIAASLATPLRRMDVEAVMEFLGSIGVSTTTSAVDLVLERNIFGVLVEAPRRAEIDECAEFEHACKLHVKDERVVTDDILQRMQSALMLASAITRARRFPPVAPICSPSAEEKVRKLVKERSVRLYQLTRKIRWKIASARKAVSHQPFLERDTVVLSEKVIPRLSSPRNFVDGSENRTSRKRTAPTRSQPSASKRVRQNGTKPLVLRLREPGISIFASQRGIEEITNASESTRRVIESVSKVASSLIRRNAMSSMKRPDALPRTSADDFSISRFPKLPR